MDLPKANRDATAVNELLAARFVNHTLHLEPDGEIINLDYDPTKLYNILSSANNDIFDAEFHSEMIKILLTYITLRKSIFKMAQNPSESFFDKLLGQLFQKYHITNEFHNDRHMTHAITMPRLMLLFPHLLAKIVTIDINVESIIPADVLMETGLRNISPACFWKSSFLLLPKFVADVGGDAKKHMCVIKAMLMAQYEQHEIIHEENEFRARKSPMERMQGVIMNCKVIYNSNHILGSMRWATYKTFLLTDPLNGEEFQYNAAGEVFDKRFPEIEPALGNIFKLKKGSGIEQGTNIEEILTVIENMKYK